MLLGRTTERAAIDALLEGIRAGRGGLVISGEPGIGKTTLLEYAAEHAESALVLRTAGAEPETELDYAALHRLLLPVLDRIDALPATPGTDALNTIFGRAAGPAPEPFLVAVATLSLLSELAAEQPLLCLVDDAHWADPASLRTLSFVVRRLADEPIAVLAATRADEGVRPDTTGWAELPLTGLDGESARTLLLGRGPVPPTELERLLLATGGNPLAIRELDATDQLGPASEPIALTEGLQRAFANRARRASAAAQQVLLVVAADGSGSIATMRRAAEALGIDPAPLTSGELDDLLRVDGTYVGFRHPLIRSATYHGASSEQRRAVHRALATALAATPGEDARRALHLGRAVAEPDESVAAELARAAERGLRRTGPVGAAAGFERAAELSIDPGLRARRLVSAARARWHSGDTDAALGLLDRAELAEGVDGADVRIELAALRGWIAVKAGDPFDAIALLGPWLADAATLDRPRLVELLMILGEAGFHANATDAWNSVARAVELVPAAGDDTDDVLLRLFRGACRVRGGREPGLRPTDLAAIEALTDPAVLGWVGGLAWGLGEPSLRRRLFRTAARRARTFGAVGTLAWVLDHLVADELVRGQLATAEAYAEEGRRFALDTGQTNTACRHLGSLALLAALRGQEEKVRRLASEVLAYASGRQLAGASIMAYRALGLAALGAGRAADALDHLRAISNVAHAHPGVVVFATPDLIEAAVRADQPDVARDWLERLAAAAAPGRSPELSALVARCRALLAAGDDREAEYRGALELHAGADVPMELARTQLLFGQFLRRERRRSDARPQLRAALTTFERLGAEPWADRARTELRATGEAVVPTPSATDALTPQELRIVEGVTEGATNRDIAAQLFISPRTVDYHLRKVFRKTGVTSRTELIRFALADRGD